MVVVIGAAVEDMEIILLLNDDSTLEVPTDLLLQAFPTAPKEGKEIEKFLLDKCVNPMPLIVTSKGADIITLEMHDQ